MGSQGEEAGESIAVMLESVSARREAFAAVGIGTSTFVVVLRVAM